MGRRIALGLAATVVALVFLEGVASVAVFLWHARMHVWLPLPERAHTAYDPELGWIAEPGARVPDLYGAGLALTTNARGFRNAEEFASAVPDGVTRAVAIGDSFTLGFGVGDADTWPARLEHQCPRVEVPNLGQAGYGVDQSVLHYVRATRDFAHQIAVAAFIADDFSRVRSSQMVLYGKPVFRLRDGRFHLENVPVPRAPYLAPWLTQNLRLLESLRSVELGRRLASAFGAERVAYVPTPEDETTRVIAYLLAEFARTARERGATPVLVLLPSLTGVDPKEFAPLPDYARAALREAADPALATFDLQSDFEAVPTSQRGALFLVGPRSRGAGAHYSTAGNTLAARAIARRLGDSHLLPPGACAPEAPAAP